MDATCTTCLTTFRNVDRDEDGAPYIETTRCTHPGCETRLCKAGCEHLSFKCDSCNHLVCESHGLTFGGERLCVTCAAEGLAMQEPECECHQTDVDMFDPRGCPCHDANSPWNVRLRAVTSVQEYESTAKEIA
jgi:hypothetical protein